MRVLLFEIPALIIIIATTVVVARKPIAAFVRKHRRLTVREQQDLALKELDRRRRAREMEERERWQKEFGDTKPTPKQLP